jgi:hypothetical protein
MHQVHYLTFSIYILDTLIDTFLLKIKEEINFIFFKKQFIYIKICGSLTKCKHYKLCVLPQLLYLL